MICIRIVTKFNAIPDGTTLELLSDKIIDKVDNYVDNAERSFQIEMPTEEQISELHYSYIYNIEVNTNKNIDSKELFNLVSVFDDVKIAAVDVYEKRFNPNQSCNNSYYWTNEGMTTYYDGSTYIDPNYTLHIDGETDYQIVYIPVYASRLQTRDKERYDKSGATYMWRCTACRDNWLKATSIDEAIEEFEQIYYDKLWTRIEHLQRELSDALNNFRWFSDYRRNKKV